jgi:hypothetical protein
MMVSLLTMINSYLAAALTTVLLLVFSVWTVLVQVTHVIPVDGLVV